MHQGLPTMLLRKPGGEFASKAPSYKKSRGGRDSSTSVQDEAAGSSVMPVDLEDDPIRRREIRSKYRTLINSVQQDREDLMSPSNNKLTKVLDEANILFKDVRLAREQVLDSHLLVLASDLGKEKANQMHAEGSAFDTTAFAEHLLTFMGLNDLESEEEFGDNRVLEGWQRLGERAAMCFRTAPTFHYMMGSFLAEPPPPKQRAERKERRPPTKEAKRVMPTQLQKMEESHQEATEKEVERILAYLRGYHAEDSSPLSYYEFVIDPDSFSRTVENMFHVSFLIRDGLARMYLDEEKLPCIAPVEEVAPMEAGAPMEEGEVDQAKKAGGERQQCIISISPKSWKEIIEVFEIKEPMIQPSSRQPVSATD